jgi:ferrochelatase
MRHARPSIADAVAEIAAAGRDRLLALCLTPQESRLSTGEYFRRLDEALAVHPGVAATHVGGWSAAPLFLEALAMRLGEALESIPPGERDATRVLFTAHSLPARLAEEGDPYPAQVLDTARAVAALAGLDHHHWALSYQSAGARPEPWLGPSLAEALAAAAGDGCRGVLVAPVGFVCDNVEILYDLDLEARCRATGLGLVLRRTATLNDSPLLAEALARHLLAAVPREVAWAAS